MSSVVKPQKDKGQSKGQYQCFLLVLDKFVRSIKEGSTLEMLKSLVTATLYYVSRCDFLKRQIKEQSTKI